MKKIGWAIAAALPLLGAPAWAHGKGEHHKYQAVKMSELPPVVQDTFQQESTGGKVEELRKETKSGEVIYKAEIVKDGQGTDIEVDSAGKVIERGTPHDESQEGERGEK